MQDAFDLDSSDENRSVQLVNHSCEVAYFMGRGGGRGGGSLVLRFHALEPLEHIASCVQRLIL